MHKLPINPFNFLKWYLIIAPKRIYITCRRFITLLNNQIAFTLNIKLLFTPLFGDYSRAGRLIGFFVRSQEVVYGTIVVGILFILAHFTPFIWWSLPFVLAVKLKALSVPVIFGAYILYELRYATLPAKRVTEVSGNEVIQAFRPEAAELLNKLILQDETAITSLFTNSKIKLVLLKTELEKPEFKKKLAEAPILNFTDVAASAHKLALKYKTRYVEAEHLFYALLENVQKVDMLLSTYGTTLPSIESAVNWLVSERETAAKQHFYQEDYTLPKMGGIGKGMTGRVTPLLDSVSEDFTKKARYNKSDKYITHEAEIKKVAELLSGDKVNVLIIGEPGSGKTSVIRNMALKVMQGTEYSALKFKRIVSLESGALMSGVRTPGDLAAKFKTILNETESSGDIILFIDEIHNLVASTGTEEATISSAYSILEPYLSSNRIQFIGATSIENYRKYIEPNGTFSRLFQIVEIPPASKPDTLEVLKAEARKMEKKYHMVISLLALQKIIDLSDKLMHDRVFPDKAIDILNRTVVSQAKATHYLTAEDAAKEISEVTHVPVSTITDDESTKLLNIEAELKKRVIGQDPAITQIGSALKRARAGMRNENKPIASFLFVGTTGVGKTETAKALARTYFGSEKTMIRVDMSEYQQVESMNRLLGSPDGKSKGILTESVRTSPFSLILLDEIEKAHPNILLMFLQVLDDGRLTDATGRIIDFTNSIIIATSNVGTKNIQDVSARNGTFEELSAVAMQDVRNHFAPEFLNRFNGVIVFRPLTLDSVQKIANLMLDSVKKMAEAKGVKVFFKPELITGLVAKGFSPEWGARPLARVIENTVETYMAVKFLSKELKMGDTVYLGPEILTDPNLSVA